MKLIRACLYFLFFTAFFPTILTQEPAFEDTVQEVTVQTGSTAVLPCSVTNLGEYQVVWTDEYSTILSYMDYRVIDNARFNIEKPWDMNIRDVNVYDAGVYSCKINTDPVMNRNVKVIVLEPPRIYGIYENNPVEVGTTVSLVCNATGSPLPNVTWYREGEIEQSGNIFTIENISETDTGVYECRAKNNVSPDAAVLIDVEVRYAPTVKVANSRVGQDVGQTAVLECVASGYPYLDVRWKKNGNVISSTDGFQIIVNKLDRKHISADLKIENITADDFGVYTCEALNDEGTKSVDVELYELPGKPRFSDTEQVVNVSLESTAILTCSVHNADGYEVKWTDAQGKVLTRDEESIAPDNRTTVLHPDLNSWNLKITNVTQTDEGEYQCHVNAHPSISRAVTLSLQEPGLYVFTVGTTAVLPCVPEQVSFTIIWRKASEASPLTIGTNRFVNDKRFHVDGNGDWALKIDNVKTKDAGKYQCTINRRGERLYVKEIVLEVNSPPVISHSPMDATAVLGSNVDLSCEASGSPEPKIIWYKTGLRKALQGTGSVLTLSNITEASEGTYMCEASNSLGRSRQVANIFVHYPTTTKIYGRKIGQSIGHTASLNCIATYSANVVWKFGGNI